MWIEATMYCWLIWGLYWVIMAKRVAKTTASESMVSRAKHLLPLALGYVLLYSNLLSGGPLEILLWPRDGAIGAAGFVLVGGSLCFAIWARVHLGKYWSGIITLKEGHRLIRSGPYQFVRHPIYTGVVLGFLGSMMALGKGRGVLAFILVTVAFIAKLRREEKNLISHFGDEYLKFRNEVPALIPFVKLF